MSLILQGASRIRQPATEFGLDFGFLEEYLCNPWSILAAVWELRSLSESVLRSLPKYKACGRTTTPLIFLL